MKANVDQGPILRTERLILRPWCDDDLPAFAAMSADARVMKYFPGTLTRDESERIAARIRQTFAERGFGFWVVEIVDVAKFAGFVGLSVPRFGAHFTPCVEIGWRLVAEHWGKGYATEAAASAMDFGLERYEEIVAFTVPHNTPSRRVMERLGMSHDPADDFDHPDIAAGHSLKRHVLYRIRREDWNRKKSIDRE